MTWYFTGATDNNWTTLTNWTENEDGSGNNPVGIPWVDDYFDYDLAPATGFASRVIMLVTIPVNVTGTCYLAGVDLATIGSGTYTGQIYVDGSYVSGGTFTNSVEFSGVTVVLNCLVTGSVILTGGEIAGGIYMQDVIVNNMIHGGLFRGDIIVGVGGNVKTGFYITKGTLTITTWNGQLLKVKGVNSVNPLPYTSDSGGLMTIQGSDVLGAGML